LERIKAESQQQFQERQRIEADLRLQLDAGKTAVEQSAAALKEEEGKRAHLEEELSGLRPECGELRRQLDQSVVELERVKAELQQQFRERQQVEADLSEQLNATKAAAERSATVLEERSSRCSLLEEALIGVRQARAELEQQQRQNAAELERARAELQQQSQERQRAEATLREELNAARVPAEQSTSALKEKESRCAELQEELIGVRQVRAALEQRQNQSAAELERVQAQLRRQSVERERLESECRSLAEAKESLNQELCRLRESQTEQPVEPAGMEPRGEGTATFPSQASADPEAQKLQTFRLTAPAAKEVFLAGDFTRWKEGAISMQKRDDGDWTASVKLQPGTYNYLFIVDHEWRDDPECVTRIRNQFGGFNSVRQIA
jgi:chromosome segregation ATPase